MTVVYVEPGRYLAVAAKLTVSWAPGMLVAPVLRAYEVRCERDELRCRLARLVDAGVGDEHRV